MDTSRSPHFTVVCRAAAASFLLYYSLARFWEKFLRGLFSQPDPACGKDKKGFRPPAFCGIIKTDEAGTLDFSGVPAFFVTIVLIVQCSAAQNVHRSEPYLISSTVAFSSSKVL